MEVEKKYYKLKLCDFYDKYGKCDKGDKCTYAHGKNELREFKKECINGLKCFKKDCKFTHPKGWNSEDNKKICEYYMNGFCKNEGNCKFRHIKDNKVDEKLDINSNNEFPFLGDVTKSNIIEENINNINDVNIDDNKKDKIFEENTKNFKDDEIKNKDLYPNVEIFINGIEYNNTDNILNINDEKNNQELKEKEIDLTDDVEELIFNLQKSFEKYTKEIKHNIDKIFIEDKQKYGIDMKLDLNKIMSEISLFKHNYQDIIKYNNNL
jgi:hypothetical protein